MHYKIYLHMKVVSQKSSILKLNKLNLKKILQNAMVSFILHKKLENCKSTKVLLDFALKELEKLVNHRF